jgi:hypothetical protein
MSFYRRYELERLVADGEAKTFRAVETATGRIVWLHIFNLDGQELAAALKAKATGPGGKPLPPVLEIGDFAGSQYAVTEAHDPFPGLRQWIDLLPDAVVAAPSVEAPASLPPTRAAVSPPPPLVDDGEFTRLFGSVESPPKTAGPNPPALLDDASGPFANPPQTPTPYPASRPGAQLPPLIHDDEDEFTRLFGRDDAFPKTAPPSQQPSLLDDASGEFRRESPTPLASAPPAIPAQERMGDFTRAFGPAPAAVPDSLKPRRRVPPPTPRRPESAIPPAAPSDWAVAGDTGEFTKLFGSGLSGEALDIASEQAKAAQAAPSESRPFQQAGDFTRIFGPAIGGSSPTAPPPAPPVSLSTSASGVFALPVYPASPAPEQPDTPAALNEYSSVFGQKPASAEPAQAPATRKPPPDIDLTAPKSRMRPAVIAGVAIGVAVLIILIVLAVMLSRR